MSLLYDDYLAEHIDYVNKGLRWMLDNLELNNDEKNALENAISAFNHDASKYDREEYLPYDAYFYGGNRSYQVVQDFNYAWLRHIHHNPHHWQYWVLLEDDPQTVEQLKAFAMPVKALAMPLYYIFEMIADWWSFSWKNENLGEIFTWYDSHRNKMILHRDTRRIVEDILEKIREKVVPPEVEVTFADASVNDDGSIEIVEHSGVKGQKWGVRNGPPYPLDSDKMSEKIFNEAKEKSKVITNDVRSAAEKAGGKIHGLENELKSVESIDRKLNKKVNEKDLSLADAANSIKDAVRYTVLSDTDNFVDTYNNFKSGMEQKGYTETSCDNYFDKFNKGEAKHKAVQSNFADADGYEFEVQFHTPESQNAKDKKLPLYNERRTTGISETRAKELEKQMEDLALEVPDPAGIETIRSHDDHLKHSDDEEDPHQYGVPEQKKFPLPDKDHVLSAIRFFNYVDPKYEKELAKAILEKIEEYGVKLGEDITVGDENKFKKYITEKE